MNSLADTTEERSPWRSLLGGAVLLAGAVIGLRWALGEQLEPRAALSALRSIEQRWWAAPLYLAVYLGGTSAFLPAALFHMVSGATFGFAPAAGLNFLAVNAAANLQFLAGRKLGRRRAASWLRHPRLRAADQGAQRYGYRAIAAIRLLPLPFAGVNLAAGLSGIRWRDFALGSMLGSLPVMLVYTYFAASLVEGVAGAEWRALLHSGAAGALLLLATFVPRALRRFQKPQVDLPASRAPSAPQAGE